MSFATRALRLSADLVRPFGADVLVVSDAAGWALEDQAQRITKFVRRPQRAVVVARVAPYVRGRTIHFLNRYAALDPGVLDSIAGQNRIVVSWTHGGSSPTVHPELLRLIAAMKRVASQIDLVHVAARMYVDVVEGFGVPRERIRLVPFAIDTDRFAPTAAQRRTRSLLGLPADVICLGSFQRDGEDRPKLVKGPDVFVELAARLRRRFPKVLVLLSGPARGYVRRALDSRGVPYRYFGLVPKETVPRLYHACDLYAVTAREEGGPLALLEAMASGVPLVSTRVGMAPDVISDGENGLLVDVDDIESLEQAAGSLIRDRALARGLAERARLRAQEYDWRTIGPRYAALYEAGGKDT